MEQKQEKASRGKPKKFTDEQLMQLAFDVKHNRLRGAKVTFLLLEKETGISRNTFSRRIASYINDINSPVGRKVELHDRDPVYFPTIDELFEMYKDKNLLRDKLHEFEIMFFDLYTEYEKLKEGSSNDKELKQTITNLKKELASTKEDAEKYEQLYKQSLIYSRYEEKRKEHDIKGNLLQFENRKLDLDLTNLNEKFNIEVEPEQEVKEETNNLLEKFGEFSDLMDDDDDDE
jgi:hypothetical protein